MDYPVGRLLRVIPVFSVDPEKGWGYSEETKPMLNTSHGYVPWDDLHHVASVANQWRNMMDAGFLPMAIIHHVLPVLILQLFALQKLLNYQTVRGNHSSPFITENTEYVVAGTRFSVPPDDKNGDVPINTYKQNFKGTISFISVDQDRWQHEYCFSDYNARESILI